MPAEAVEELRRRRERVADVDAVGRARRAVSVHDDADGRLRRQPLHDARGDDPRDALVSVRQVEHLRGGAVDDLRLGLVRHRLLDVLALDVVPVDGHRRRARLLAVVGEDEAQGLRAGRDAPRGVDARAEEEAEVARGVAHDAARRGLEEKLLESDGREAVEAREGLRDEDAVLPEQRHDVRHRGEPREDEERPRERRPGVEPFRARLRGERVREEERDARAAEVFEPLGMRDLGVDDDAVRQRLARKMVVGDDDLDAARPERGDRLDGVDSVVDRHDEPDAGVRGEHPCDGGVRHAVALGQPLREERRDVRAERRERAHEDRRRAHAVAVVVAEDDDLLPAAHGGEDRVRRRVDAGQLGGGREVAERGIEERLALRGGNAAVREYLLDQLRNLAAHVGRIEKLIFNSHLTSRHQPCLSSTSPYWMPWTRS